MLIDFRQQNKYNKQTNKHSSFKNNDNNNITLLFKVNNGLQLLPDSCVCNTHIIIKRNTAVVLLVYNHGQILESKQL